jgi:hypothetical protein
MVMSEDAAPTLAEELKSIVEAGERPPFSVPAYELLRAKIAEYISDLVRQDRSSQWRGRCISDARTTRR